MIEKLVTINANTFDRNSLGHFKPYFDTNVVVGDQDTQHLWFNNLLCLAQYDLSMAHCVHHNHASRMLIEIKAPLSIKNQLLKNYDQQITCFSNVKSADSLSLNNFALNGTKHWISLVHCSDFGIFRVPINDTEAYVIVDFVNFPCNRHYDYSSPVGMEGAAPGSFTVNNLDLPAEYILGYRNFHQQVDGFSHVSNYYDYAFITNYLGIIVGLFKQFETYAELRKINVDFELKKLRLSIATLKMLWEDNIETVSRTQFDNKFWHKRNTQYCASKETLLNLVNSILSSVDSTWLDRNHLHSQRLRDALTFCSHMRPLIQNLAEKHFVNF